MTFAAQAVATVSAAQTVTVTNSGNAALTVSQVVMTGDFTETDTCVGAAIAAGSTCSVQVKFLPTATGTRSGVLTVYGNVAGGQATATLSGIGTPAACGGAEPDCVTFPGDDRWGYECGAEHYDLQYGWCGGERCRRRW